MALVNNGTKVSVPLTLQPTGFTAPSVTEFTDHEYTRTFSLSVLKATVDESSKAATFLAIIENATVGIDKQVDDIMAADYISSNTVTYYSDWTAVSNNARLGIDTEFFSNVAVSYVVTVVVYIKTA